jgi:hypothetical protein
MRSYQVFAGLAPDHAHELLKRLAEKAPAMFVQALAAASAAMKARPIYLQRQPFEKRADAVRRTLSRVATNPIADEVLAVYFLECRKELLVEWLDLAGIEHKDGTLAADTPAQPPEKKLREAVERFRGAGEDRDRELLLRAFAAQDAIEWPALDALLASPGAAPPPSAAAKPAPKPAAKPATRPAAKPRRARKPR